MTNDSQLGSETSDRKRIIKTPICSLNEFQPILSTILFCHLFAVEFYLSLIRPDGGSKTGLPTAENASVLIGYPSFPVVGVERAWASTVMVNN